MKKRILLISLFALLLMGATAAANADTINVTTNPTLGCFGTCSQPTDFAVNAGANLTFAGHGDSQLLLPGTSIDLGTFTLSSVEYDWGKADSNGEDFWVKIVFAAPPGANLLPQYADVYGKISNGGVGTVNVAFGDTPIYVAYNGGSFTFTLNNVDLKIIGKDGKPANTGDLTATIRDSTTNPVVPEPTSMLLLGTGLLGGIGALRRKIAVLTLAIKSKTTKPGKKNCPAFCDIPQVQASDCP